MVVGQYTKNFDISAELITILSLMFTLVSILISIGEYLLSRQLLKSDSFVIITFEAKCADFKNMKKRTFNNNIIFRKNLFINNLSRLLKIEPKQIERLKPLHTQNGAIFKLFIESKSVNQIISIFENKIIDGSVAVVIRQSYKLKKKPKISNVNAIEVNSEKINTVVLKPSNTGSSLPYMTSNTELSSDNNIEMPEMQLSMYNKSPKLVVPQALPQLSNIPLASMSNDDINKTNLQTTNSLKLSTKDEQVMNYVVEPLNLNDTLTTKEKSGESVEM